MAQPHSWPEPAERISRGAAAPPEETAGCSEVGRRWKGLRVVYWEDHLIFSVTSQMSLAGLDQ